MSKKNLARTVIEGGRNSGNKWDRRYSHAEARAHEKMYLVEVKQDIENWYDYDVEPLETVYKTFQDKLGPMQRWLAKQCGRPWDEVRSDVSKTFDTRTTAGRHIVHDHLLKSVEETPDLHYGRYYSRPEDYTTSYRRYEFYVDEDGLLREKTVIKRRGSEKIPACNVAQVANWLNGRIVGKVGKRLFWFAPADKSKKGGYAHIWRTEWGYPRNSRMYYYSYNQGLRFTYLDYEVTYKKDSVGQIVMVDGKMVELERKAVWKNASDPSLRQDRRLNDKELFFWNTIPEYYQAKILERSPTASIPYKPDYYGRYY